MHKVPKPNEFGLPTLKKITPEMIEGMVDDSDIDRRDLAAAALAAGATVQVAARVSGVSERNVYRWKTEPGFQGRIESAWRSHVEALKYESLRAIRQLLRKGPPEVRERLAVRIAESQGALPPAQVVDVQPLAGNNVLFLPLKTEEIPEDDVAEA